MNKPSTKSPKGLVLLLAFMVSASLTAQTLPDTSQLPTFYNLTIIDLYTDTSMVNMKEHTGLPDHIVIEGLESTDGIVNGVLGNSFRVHSSKASLKETSSWSGSRAETDTSSIKADLIEHNWISEDSVRFRVERHEKDTSNSVLDGAYIGIIDTPSLFTRNPGGMGMGPSSQAKEQEQLNVETATDRSKSSYRWVNLLWKRWGNFTGKGGSLSSFFQQKKGAV